MPKYWGKQISTNGRFPVKRVKSRRRRKKEKKRKRRWKQLPASLPSATTGAANKPPGPIILRLCIMVCKFWKRYSLFSLFVADR